MAAVEKLKKKTERSELSPKDSNAMAERLQVAEETISILNAANNQLNEELCALRSDFAVLEGLLIESGQTLERLQEMYHHEKESNGKLSTALDKANAKIQELEREKELRGSSPSSLIDKQTTFASATPGKTNEASQSPSTPPPSSSSTASPSLVQNIGVLLSRLLGQTSEDGEENGRDTSSPSQSSPEMPANTAANSDKDTDTNKAPKNRSPLKLRPGYKHKRGLVKPSSSSFSSSSYRSSLFYLPQEVHKEADISSEDSVSLRTEDTETFDVHRYHVNVRDALRSLAEGLCDELVRVEENLGKVEPLMKQIMSEEEEELMYSGALSSSGNNSDSGGNSSGTGSSSGGGRRSRSPSSNRMIIGDTMREREPDFLFGSPSLRMSVSEVVHEEEEDEGEEH